jgi:hypothetical protein
MSAAWAALAPAMTVAAVNAAREQPRDIRKDLVTMIKLQTHELLFLFSRRPNGRQIRRSKKLKEKIESARCANLPRHLFRRHPPFTQKTPRIISEPVASGPPHCGGPFPGDAP